MLAEWQKLLCAPGAAFACGAQAKEQIFQIPKNGERVGSGVGTQSITEACLQFFKMFAVGLVAGIQT